MKELIKFLEKRGLYKQVDSLRNGDRTLDLNYGSLRVVTKQPIGESGAKELAEALKVNNSLTSLNLWGNNIGEQGARSLAKALKANNSLTSLDLGGNNIGEQGAMSLAKALKANNSLTSLNLWGNNIGEQGARSLDVLMKANNSLTSLNLSINNIDDQGAMSLAKALKANNSLTSLNLSRNKIGEQGARSLAKALKANNSLTSLDVAENKIGEQGAMSLAEALKVNSSLAGIHLSCNNIGEQGAMSLAEALKVNSSLAWIQLSCNNINDQGAKSLAGALKVNSSLAGIYLSCNRIGEQGAMSLVEALKVNSSLVSLSLDDRNKVTWDTIHEYLRRNETIAEKKAESLNAEGNNLYSQEKYNEAIEKYKAAIKINSKDLYKENKAKAEKKYEEQQQSLKLKQQASVTNENKAADIKDSAQESLRDKLAIFQKIVTETIVKIEDNTAISITDKNVMQNSINEIIRTIQTFTNKTDIDTMIKSIDGLAKNKITKARIAVVEEDLSEIIEQQIKLEESIRTEKLAVFQKVVEEMSTKVENNQAISEKDKDTMQNSIKEIISKVQRLANKADIDIITESVKELISGKITKARIAVVEEDVEQLIEQQSKPSHNITVGKVEEIIYDNPLLNHPKLLQAAIANKLSPDLIHEAINNNDEELILAGLISMGYDVGSIN